MQLCLLTDPYGSHRVLHSPFVISGHVGSRVLLVPYTAQKGDIGLHLLTLTNTKRCIFMFSDVFDVFLTLLT